MDYIKDALKVNSLSLKKTMKSMKYYPIIVVALIFIGLINVLASFLLMQLSRVIPSQYVLGILSYLVDVATMSLLLSCLYSAINGYSLNLKNFTDGWQRFINPLMATRFILWLIEMALEIVLGPIFIVAPLGMMIIYFIFDIFQSPMLETIYIGHESGMEGIQSMFEFLKANIIQWIPIVIVFSIIMGYLREYPMFLMLIKGFDIQRILFTILSYLILAFIYIYKGHLYSLLHNSSMRKRQFMGVFDNDTYR